MAPPFPSITKTWHTKPYPAIESAAAKSSVPGKHIVITGGAGVIGTNIAVHFAKAGAASIGLIDISDDRLTISSNTILAAAPGIHVSSVVADLSSLPSTLAAFDKLHLVYGKTDIFIASAGYLSPPKDIANADADDWWKCFEINVKGGFNALQSFLKFAALDAFVLNVSSGVAAMPPIFGNSAYAASKLANAKTFEYLQAENPGLHVVNVQPGVFQTPLTAGSGWPHMDNSRFLLSLFNTVERDDAYTEIVDLPGAFFIWLTSPEAKFLKGKLVYANFDIEELKAKSSEIEAGALSLTLGGWPWAD